MKRTYFLSIVFSLGLAAPSLATSVYAQSNDGIASEEPDASPVVPTTDETDDAIGAREDTATSDQTDAEENDALDDDSSVHTADELESTPEPTDDLDGTEEPLDLSDTIVRESETAKICEAACTGAPNYDGCFDTCTDQTNACFELCDELPANKNDCFVGCTHIAVDERDRQEEIAQRILEEEREPVYGRKFGFGMNLVGGLHNVPNFLVGAFFERSIPHWEDGAKFFYGGEFVFRFDDRHDLLLTIDYANYQTPDGWWLEKNKNATAAEWVQNDLRALAITVGWNGILNLDKKKRTQFYGGVGLGVTIKIGDFNKAKVRLGCVNPDTDLSVYDSLSIDGPCPDDSGRVLGNQDASGEITEWTKEKIPAVLPSFVATAGIRYIIADTVSVGVEGGFKTVAFYGAVKVGFIMGKSNATRKAEMHRAAIRDEY